MYLIAALGLIFMMIVQLVLIGIAAFLLYFLIKALVKPDTHNDEDHNINMRF